MRVDRAHNALRPVTIQRGPCKYAEGSAFVAFGDTHVLCTASFEPQVPPWRRGAGKGWVTAEYAMLPRATLERTSRDAAKKGRAQEISRLIGRSLRAVVDPERQGENMIVLDCDVLQADGGTRTAAITGAYVALADACQRLVGDGRLDAMPLTGQCAAISAGIVGQAALLDLCYEEDRAAEVDLNVVMDHEGRLIEIQGCSEGRPFTRAQLNAMVDLAAGGIQTLIAKQNEALQA